MADLFGLLVQRHGELAQPVQIAVGIRRVLVPIEGEADEVPAEGEQASVEVLSWESVGKLGARALALGKLEREGS